MTFWIAGSVLTAMTTLAVLAPMLWQSRKIAFNGRAQAVYSDQLQEVDRDEKIGLISPLEAEAARVEVKHRMLTAARHTNSLQAVHTGGGRWAIFVVALFIPVAGITTYLSLGTPQMPSATFASRSVERNQAQDFNLVVARLRNRLEADPAPNIEGWMMLTQTYLKMGRVSDAVWAISTLIDKGAGADRPELYAVYAEALIQADNGVVSPKAEAAIDKVLSRQPKNIAGIYYKSMALEQSGELMRAFVMLRDRLTVETSYQPWMETVIERANWLAGRVGAEPLVVPVAQTGPTAADVAAAGKMSGADRQDFIRSMVQRLADRLAEQPDDLDGWIKLGGAYRVLGEKAKSVDAYKAAGKLVASLEQSDARRALIAAGLAQE